MLKKMIFVPKFWPIVGEDFSLKPPRKCNLQTICLSSWKTYSSTIGMQKRKGDVDFKKQSIPPSQRMGGIFKVTFAADQSQLEQEELDGTRREVLTE